MQVNLRVYSEECRVNIDTEIGASLRKDVGLVQPHRKNKVSSNSLGTNGAAVRAGDFLHKVRVD